MTGIDDWVSRQRDLAAESLSIGDPIEVLALRVPPVRLERSRPPPFSSMKVIAPKQEWIPATVTFINEHEIGVAFSDGERLAVSRNSGGPKQWRKP